MLEAGKYGNGFPAAVNAASEVAVNLFLKGAIGYNDIHKAIYGTMQAFYGEHHVNIDALMESDAFGRKYVYDLFGVK